MNNFNFCSPTEFIFGKGRENECGDYVRKYGGSKVLIHHGGKSAIKSGLLDRVKNALEEKGIAFCELGGVQPNPRDTLVYKGMIIVQSTASQRRSVISTSVVLVKYLSKTCAIISAAPQAV